MTQKWRGSHEIEKLLTKPNKNIPKYFNMPQLADVFEFKEDFMEVTVATTKWTLTEDAGKTGPDANAGHGGVFTQFADGDDNDESYRYAVNSQFLLAAGRYILFEARIMLTEQAVNKANWIIGLASNGGADMLTDNGAGPAANYSGVVFFKVDGTMYIQFETSNGVTQVTDATLAAFTSGVEYVLGFLIDPNDDTTAKCTPYVYNETTKVLTTGTTRNLTIAALTAMAPAFGVKMGGTNAEESIAVDYIHAVATR